MARNIKFNKMPVRSRGGSSPRVQKNEHKNHSEENVSYSRTTVVDGSRHGYSQRNDGTTIRRRAGTTTSSELSSENEVGPTKTRENQRSTKRAVKASQLLSFRVSEEAPEHMDLNEKQITKHEASSVVGSTLSSEFSEIADSNSLLEHVDKSVISSPKNQYRLHSRHVSSQSSKQMAPLSQDLPPPRPISMVKPVSILSQAIKANSKKPASPLDRFAPMSGKGDPNPLYIKMYAPFSNQPTKPYEILLRRSSNDGEEVTVAQAIGFSIWLFSQERIQPELTEDQLNPNKWTLRIVEDEEVDYDFPPLSRTRPIADFTSNNNRAASRRMREKPWDEFAIVKASTEQFEENEKATPEIGSNTTVASHAEVTAKNEDASQQASAALGRPDSVAAPYNPITGPGFAPIILRKDSVAPLDTPIAPVSHATPRIGASKLLTIHYIDNDFNSQTITLNVTTDTYIGEVFDQICKKLNTDKGSFVLKVAGTSTVAPSDRTIEALGGHHTLDLARRRFVADKAYGISGSPGSSSPNAPLLISTVSTPKKNRKGTQMQNLMQRPEMVSSLSTFSSTNSKRYVVSRKQPMSFNSSSSRILAIENDYIHVMPCENTGGTKVLFDSTPKTVTAHFSSIVGSQVSRRHPRNFRVMIYRERETKRYDFEAANENEAHEIVGEIQAGMEKHQDVVI